MEAVLSLIPSDEPTREPIPELEDHTPTPVFLLPPESDPEFAKACLKAKLATSTTVSLKKIPKQHQARALAFGNKWIYGTEYCPTRHKDENGNETVGELSDVPGWKKLDKIVPKILALGEKYHMKDVVDEDEEGNA